MNARLQLSTPAVAEVRAIGLEQQREMYALYARYYDGSSFEVFQHDLLEKDRVVLLRAQDGNLQGFSTLAVYTREFERMPVRVVFSGDTIIDERCWGSQAFAFTWLRFVGVLKAQAPQTPLYWLLISKGHRTYRYLPAFSREYHPAHDRGMPSRMQTLIDFLATDRFGAAYDAATGILRFDQSQGHLRTHLARIPEKDLRLPEVQYFLRRNPGYVQGDELVCLCELAADNLKPIARRVFESGAALEAGA